MEFRLKCEKPGEIVYTLTATMTADEWEKVRENLTEGNAAYYEPGGKLKNAITDLLAQARKIYWPNDPSASKAASQADE